MCEMQYNELIEKLNSRIEKPLPRPNRKSEQRIIHQTLQRFGRAFVAKFV